WIVIAVVFLLLCCIVPMATGILGNLLERFTSEKTSTPKAETFVDQVTPTKSVTFTPAPTPTEEPLSLKPNFPQYPDTACFLRLSEGLTCLDEEGWHVYNRNDFNFPFYLPSFITQCSDGRVYLDVGGFYLLRDEELIELEDSPSSIEDLACGPGEEIWVAHYEGVSHFDGSNWATYSAEEHLGSGNYVKLVSAIALAPDGDVWVTTSDSIATFDGLNWQVFEVGQGFDEEPNPKDLIVDSLGNVWVISDYDTLMKYDGAQWTSFKSPEGILEQLASDADNKIWAATDHGIRILDPDIGNWSTTFGEETFIDDNIKAIQFDQQGRLWAASRYGLYVYDGQTWTGYHMHTADIFDNEADDVFVIGNGPPLPPLMEKEPGSVSGRLINPDETLYSNIQVEICLHGVIIAFYGETPCASQAYHALATVNPDGSFYFSDITIGKYTLMIQLNADTWKNWEEFEVFP
ncbi:MAG: hypothetical protein ACK2TV_04635, partial [Anaerolineales bacterium]